MSSLSVRRWAWRGRFQPRPRLLACSLAGVCGLLLPLTLAEPLPSIAPVEYSGALFTSTRPSGANPISTKAIFSRERRTVASRVIDDSAGSGLRTNDSDPLAVTGDGLYVLTKNWPSGSYDSNRYSDVTFTSPLPTGIAVSDVQAHVVYATDVASDDACLYFQLYQASGTYLGISPQVCTGSNGGYKTVSQSFPGATSTDAVNASRMRIFAFNNNARALRFDRIVVTGTMTAGGVSTPFTLHRANRNDRADGVDSMRPWSLALEDGNVYQHSYASPTAFTNGYHVDFTFPMNSQGYVPSNASVSDVRIYHRWRSSSTSQLCYNVQLYAADGTLLASGGTSSAPYVCRTSTTMETDVITVDAGRITAANANGLILRLSFRAATTGIGPFHDYLALGVNYSA